MQAVIDRFEENKAVLLLGDEEMKVIFPKQYLPDGVKEGDYLQIDIAYDEAATAVAKSESERLLRDVQQMNNK
jgi:hypothetical protein